MSTSSTDIRGQAEESVKKLVMDSRTAVRGGVWRRPRAREEHPQTWHGSLLGTGEGLMRLTDAVLNFFSCKTSPTPSTWNSSLRAFSAKLHPYASCTGWE